MYSTSVFPTLNLFLEPGDYAPTALDVLDARISALVSAMPREVLDAEHKAIMARRRTNAQNVWIGAAIGAGTVILQAGLNIK